MASEQVRHDRQSSAGEGACTLRGGDPRKLPSLQVSREITISDSSSLMATAPRGRQSLSEMFVFPAACPIDHDGRNGQFKKLRELVERLSASWQSCVASVHAVSALRVTLPELDRHEFSQAGSLSEFTARLASGAPSTKEVTRQRDLACLRDFQLASDQFAAEHWALKHAMDVLIEFVKQNGLAGDIKVGYLKCPVPFSDGQGAHTHLFMHNLAMALRLLLTVKQEYDLMEAYRRGLPNYSWVISEEFGRARQVHKELDQGLALICFMNPD